MIRIVFFWIQLDLHLFQEVVKRLHKVINEVKFVMIHLRWHYDRTGSGYESLQSLRVLKTYQLVSLSVHEESRTPHTGHHIDVAEPIIDQVLEHIASLLSHDVSYRHKRAHQETVSYTHLTLPTNREV